jgi:hypothetical protein
MRSLEPRNAAPPPTDRQRRGARNAKARDGDRRQARRRVRYLIECGELAGPETLPCADCGHLGDDLPHEYDHHLGYAAEHHEDVEPVCPPCHRGRHGRGSTVVTP